MGNSSLGRVLDPSVLDACAGAHARLRIEVPARWLAEGVDLRITAPSRLPCARCDGGGCDACARSGVLRAPAESEARVVHTSLPSGVGGGPRSVIVVRIPRPFGDEHEIHQLLLEVAEGEAPSTLVERLVPPAPLARAIPTPGPIPVPMLLLAVVAAILWALFGR